MGELIKEISDIDKENEVKYTIKNFGNDIEIQINVERLKKGKWVYETSVYFNRNALKFILGYDD